MKHKKISIVAVLLFCLVFAASFFVFQSKTGSSKNADSSIQSAPLVTVTVDTGETVATASGIVAANAFQALVEVAKQKNLALKTKQYDFGVFVEQVGTLTNTKEQSWIYTVNGKSGTVAADKQQLQQGDSVEWKYIQPIF